MLNRQGWIKIHRQILNNPIVTKDGDHFAVWVFLLLEAQHKPYKKIFRGEKITLEAGQLITGRKVISATLGINESKVFRVLKSLKSEQQIEQQTSNKSSMITILNWSRYQVDEQQNEQQVNNNRTASEQQVNTLQECKTVNNENNGKNNKPAKAVLFSDEDMQLARTWGKSVSERSPSFKLTSEHGPKWANTIRLMRERDNRTVEEIAKFMDAVHKDDFWSGNIFDLTKLRKHINSGKLDKLIPKEKIGEVSWLEMTD